MQTGLGVFAFRLASKSNFSGLFSILLPGGYVSHMTAELRV